MEKTSILEFTFQFSLKVIDLCTELEGQRKYIISNQLLKSATSIGANVREAQNPHSRPDFISKMVIAMKEADETEYWLLLCNQSKHYPDVSQFLIDISSIKKIIGSIITSAKKNSSKAKI